MANPLWAEKCAKAGLRTLVLNPESRDSVRKDILLIGEATGRTDAAKKITTLLSNRPAMTARTIIVIWDGVMAGPDSYLDEPLAAAGLQSALSRGAWVKFDWELLVSAKPDAVLWVQNSGVDSPITTSPEKAVEMGRIPGVRDLDCVKKKHVYKVNSGSNWLPGSGLTKSLDEIVRIRNAIGQ
jgi:ABC-type Fe3+-hydroxamate transport system substrate-binding protein